MNFILELELIPPFLVAMTRPRRHLVSSNINYVMYSIHWLMLSQCVVGDSSTISRGGSYLAKWMEWLEENADVRFGGSD